MPNIAKVIKDETSRIARKECRLAVAPLRKSANISRRTFADLKRRLAALEKICERFEALSAKAPQPQVEPASGEKSRITARGMRSLRRKLRLTGKQFARLLGVTSKIVYQWEKQEGPLRVRNTTRAAILSIRGLGAKEAKARLTKDTK